MSSGDETHPGEPRTHCLRRHGLINDDVALAGIMADARLQRGQRYLLNLSGFGVNANVLQESDGATTISSISARASRDSVSRMEAGRPTSASPIMIREMPQAYDSARSSRRRLCHDQSTRKPLMWRRIVTDHPELWLAATSMSFMEDVESPSTQFIDLMVQRAGLADKGWGNMEFQKLHNESEGC